jgi:hypothetical protein
VTPPATRRFQVRASQQPGCIEREIVDAAGLRETRSNMPLAKGLR